MSTSPTPRRTPTRALPAALVAARVAALLLSGCTGGTETSSPSTTPTPTPTEAAAPKPPREGACYRLTVRDAARPSNSSKPVRCSTAHTTLTIAVDRLPRPRHGKTPDVTSPGARKQLNQRCAGEMSRFLGGDLATARLARFQVVWFVPTPDELAAGGRWVRCDLLAFGRAADLMTLPHLRLQGVLDRPVGLQVFGVCGTAAPGAKGFERVACRFRHSWTAISTIPIAGGDRYPGAPKVRRAGDATCADQVNSRTSALKFAYGWEWPTRAQWSAGQRFGYCWAPASLA